jgi:hypothetical protein
VNKLFVISGTIKQIVFKEIKILSDCFSKITVNLIVDASTEDMNEYRIQCYMSDDYLTKRIDYFNFFKCDLLYCTRNNKQFIHVRSGQ